MNHLSEDMNAALIFEGVETKAEYEYLLQHTQGGVQGFYFLKPQMGEDVRAYLDAAAQTGRALARG